VDPTARTASPTRVVITADDFGLSPQVDTGILEAFRRGVVRSTALLVNFPDVRESVVRLRDAPGLEVGIHLNLTAGPPVLKSQNVRSLVRADGNFHDFTTFFGRVSLGRINWDEVFSEWDAQINLGISLGCQFTFLTSHQHVHMVPAAAQVIARLARKFGVGAVRLSAFRLRDMLRPLRLKALALAPVVPSVRRIFRHEGVFCNDSIFEIPPGNPDAALLQLCGIIKRIGDGVHELVCHPGYVDPLLAARDSYVAARPIELAVLTDPGLPIFLQSVGAEVISFQAATGLRGSNRGRPPVAENSSVGRHSS
jgi:predicted glycoside hydrolase/deacetylase ChbG (UPF0249 family)